MTLADRVKSEMERQGLSQAALADIIGVSQQAIARLVSGHTKRFKYIIELAEALNVTPEYLLKGTGEKKPANSTHLEVAFAEVHGKVRAGYWVEPEVADEFQRKRIPFVPNPLFAGFNHCAVEVDGPSMNLEYDPGTYVVYAHLNGQNNYEFRNHDHVVVRRTNPDGAIEMTLKELVTNDGKPWELWPRSDNPNHQTPIIYDDKEGSTVEIIGVVVGAWKERVPPP